MKFLLGAVTGSLVTFLTTTSVGRSSVIQAVKMTNYYANKYAKKYAQKIKGEKDHDRSNTVDVTPADEKLPRDDDAKN